MSARTSSSTTTTRTSHDACSRPPRQMGTAATRSAAGGNYYAAGMDEAGIAAAGAEPLRTFLDRIDAASSVADIRAIAVDLHRLGAGPLFGIGVEADFEDADVYLAYVQQAGLGLPERGLLPQRRRAVGGAARCLPGPRGGPARQPRRPAGRGRGRRRGDPRLRATPGRGLPVARAAPGPARDAQPARGRVARRRGARFRLRVTLLRESASRADGQRRQPRVLPGPRRRPGGHAGRGPPRLPALAPRAGDTRRAAGRVRGRGLLVLRPSASAAQDQQHAHEARHRRHRRRHGRGPLAAVRGDHVPAVAPRSAARRWSSHHRRDAAVVETPTG